jgi:hypothetical protein
MNEQQIKEREQRKQQWINERALECRMTERIKTLALQAGMFLDSNDLMPGATLMLWDHDIQKLAELIVRDCMDVVSKKCASPTAYNALVEHFGVAE